MVCSLGEQWRRSERRPCNPRQRPLQTEIRPLASSARAARSRAPRYRAATRALAKRRSTAARASTATPTPRGQPREQTGLRRARGADNTIRFRAAPNQPSPTEETQMAVMAEKPAGDPTIRPFTIETPEADLDDLRARIEATRWPTSELVDDRSQGVQLATMQALARYWTTEYDFRRLEARRNALPQFTTEIDGLDIHFIHVRFKHEDALPVVITHGWPGSVVEMLNVVGPLTDPTAHGGSADDAFHLVVPSMPGYGFSAKPTATGWGPVHIADAWIELMRRLGYTQ